MKFLGLDSDFRTPIRAENVISMIGRTYHNVLMVDYHNTATRIKIKTKIPYLSGHIMPSIHLVGYAYGAQAPIELKVSFYIYNGNFINLGATCNGAWRPDIILSNEGGFVCITLEGSIYFPKFQVDYFDTWSDTTRQNYAEGWTWDQTESEITNQVWVPYRDPYLNASLMNSGTLALARIPSLPASKITQDVDNRFVTDIQIASWTNKPDSSAIPTKLSELTNDIGAGGGIKITTSTTAPPGPSPGDFWNKIL